MRVVMAIRALHDFLLSVEPVLVTGPTKAHLAPATVGKPVFQPLRAFILLVGTYISLPFFIHTQRFEHIRILTATTKLALLCWITRRACRHVWKRSLESANRSTTAAPSALVHV